MVDPNLISLGLLGLSVIQTVALAYIAAKYNDARAKQASDASAKTIEAVVRKVPPTEKKPTEPPARPS